MTQTISRKDSEFNEQQEVITSMVQKNLSQWGIDPAWFNSQVLAAKNAWVAAWTAYQDPAQRTPLITFTKNKARKTYEKLTRVLVQILKSNPRVTDGDRRAMGIMIRDLTRTPVKPPKTFPEFIVNTSIIRCLIILFWDLGSHSKAKPCGVHGAEIRWAILDRPPVSIEELTRSGFDTRSPFKLMFDESDRGKTVYFCLCWESARGEKGPWSEIVMAIIP
jgi:hypothetical protein